MLTEGSKSDDNSNKSEMGAGAGLWCTFGLWSLILLKFHSLNAALWMSLTVLCAKIVISAYPILSALTYDQHIPSQTPQMTSVTITAQWTVPHLECSRTLATWFPNSWNRLHQFMMCVWINQTTSIYWIKIFRIWTYFVSWQTWYKWSKLWRWRPWFVSEASWIYVCWTWLGRFC